MLCGWIAKILNLPSNRVIVWRKNQRPHASFWQAVLTKKNGAEKEAEKYLQQADENLVNKFETLAALTATGTGE